MNVLSDLVCLGPILLPQLTGAALVGLVGGQPWTDEARYFDSP